MNELASYSPVKEPRPCTRPQGKHCGGTSPRRAYHCVQCHAGALGCSTYRGCGRNFPIETHCWFKAKTRAIRGNMTRGELISEKDIEILRLSFRLAQAPIDMRSAAYRCNANTLKTVQPHDHTQVVEFRTPACRGACTARAWRGPGGASAEQRRDLKARHQRLIRSEARAARALLRGATSRTSPRNGGAGDSLEMRSRAGRRPRDRWCRGRAFMAMTRTQIDAAVIDRTLWRSALMSRRRVARALRRLSRQISSESARSRRFSATVLDEGSTCSARETPRFAPEQTSDAALRSRRCSALAPRTLPCSRVHEPGKAGVRIRRLVVAWVGQFSECCVARYRRRPASQSGRGEPER